MNVQLISQELKIEDTYVTITYGDGDIKDITAQEKDGTVLFSGSLSQARRLVDALSNIAILQKEICN